MREPLLGTGEFLLARDVGKLGLAAELDGLLVRSHPRLAQEGLGLALRGLNLRGAQLGNLAATDALLVAHVGVAEGTAENNPAGFGKAKCGEQGHAEWGKRGKLPTFNVQRSTFNPPTPLPTERPSGRWKLSVGRWTFCCFTRCVLCVLARLIPLRHQPPRRRGDGAEHDVVRLGGHLGDDLEIKRDSDCAAWESRQQSVVMSLAAPEAMPASVEA